MAIFAVDLINLIYISHLGDPALTAAVGYAGAVTFFSIAFGVGLSIGVSLLVAKAVGARDPSRARELASAGLLLGVVFALVLTALLWLALPWIVTLIGAIGRTADYRLGFLRQYVLSQPFMILSIIGSAILRAHGEARRAMMVTVWGARGGARHA